MGRPATAPNRITKATIRFRFSAASGYREDSTFSNPEVPRLALFGAVEEIVRVLMIDACVAGDSASVGAAIEGKVASMIAAVKADRKETP